MSGKYLLEEIMPFGEGKYRIAAAQPTRAFGNGQTPDDFGNADSPFGMELLRRS
jgi:hypothetical protein